MIAGTRRKGDTPSIVLPPPMPGLFRFAGVVLAFSAWSLVAAAGLPAAALDAFQIRSWETDDGLPRNSVIALIQSHEGYLWLGTLNGLVRFDGMRFTVYGPDVTPGLKGERVVCLFEDSRHRLWIGTEEAGVLLAEGGRVRSLPIGGTDSSGRLVSACEDRLGGVWLLTAGGELARCLGDQVDVWALHRAGRSSYLGLIAEDNGLVWVGADDGVLGLDPAEVKSQAPLPEARWAPVPRLERLVAAAGGGYWQLADGRVQQVAPDGRVTDWGPYPWAARNAPVAAACLDREGRLVVGTLGAGVWWFEEGGRVRRFTTKEGLSNDYILALAADREGCLWVGTDGGGLNRIRPSLFATVKETRGRVVQAVAQGPDGTLWVGYNGGGLSRFREDALTTWNEGAFRLPVRAIVPEGPDHAWVGLMGGGVVELREGRPAAFQPTGLFVVLAMCRDAEGRLWVGGEGGAAYRQEDGWRRLTPEQGLATNRVRALAATPDGAVWLGTEGGGLQRWHDGRIQTFRREPGGLASDSITFLQAEAEGRLWVGTLEAGLCTRSAAGEWRRLGPTEGLPSRTVGFVTRDEAGRLWVGTPQGLFRVEKAVLDTWLAGRTNHVHGRVYERADGLPTREGTIGPGWQLPPPGEAAPLWVPTIKGLATANPEAVRPNTFPPPVVIERISVEGDDNEVEGLAGAPPRQVVLPPGRRRLEIYYTSLNLAAPERTRFRHRLRGLEESWTEAGSVRVARFTGLPPGRYLFEVEALNEDHVRSREPATVAIVVLPPFWRTWWFMSLTGLTLLGAVVGTVHFISTQRLKQQLAILRQQEALEKERARIARDLHDQLGASLAEMALLSELLEADKDDPEEVEIHARQIAQTARETTRVLDEIVWAVNPRNDSLDGLVTYLCKNAQEHLTLAGLRYRQEVPDHLPEVPVPPEVRHHLFLAAREAVTNVIKHAQATEVHVALRWDQERRELEIVVEDDGLGPAGAATARQRGRHGLENMERRLAEMGGRFEIGPRPGGGTRVRLVVPLARR